MAETSFQKFSTFNQLRLFLSLLMCDVSAPPLLLRRMLDHVSLGHIVY